MSEVGLERGAGVMQARIHGPELQAEGGGDRFARLTFQLEQQKHCAYLGLELLQRSLQLIRRLAQDERLLRAGRIRADDWARHGLGVGLPKAQIAPFHAAASIERESTKECGWARRAGSVTTFAMRSHEYVLNGIVEVRRAYAEPVQE
jgi:hypothetical protein